MKLIRVAKDEQEQRKQGWKWFFAILLLQILVLMVSYLNQINWG